jgi:hypothetical protein
MQNVDGQVLFVATGALFAGGTLQAKIQTSTAAGGPFADVPGAVFPDMSGAGPMQGLIVDRALLKSFFRVVCNGDPQGNISIIAVAIKKSLT